MTKCIPCGPSSPGQQRPSPPATSPFSEEQRITQKIENMRKDLTARGCTQKHLNFFEKTARSMKDYGQDLKTFELVLDANFQTVVRDCESKKKLMKIIEEEKREKDRLMKAKVALLHKIKKAPIYTSSIQVKYPPLNPSLMEVSKKDAPMIDGRDSRILSKIAEWYKSGIKNVAIDWLTEKTNLPIDKIDKALSVGSLIKEAVVEPVFSYLEEVKLSLGNSAQWEALVIRSYEVVEEAEKSISNEAKSTLAEEFIGGIPVVGGLLNKFYSAGRTSLEIWEERK
ncbi:MAG: hypothetical protein NZ851_01385 [Aquificaceae bacterium]|nr:hypothetical protein [Aquificaceae bacterium]